VKIFTEIVRNECINVRHRPRDNKCQGKCAYQLDFKISFEAVTLDWLCEIVC